MMNFNRTYVSLKIVIFYLFLTRCSESLKVLLIGDSVDYNSVVEFCYQQQSNAHYNFSTWTDRNIQYLKRDGDRANGAICKGDNNISIANLRIFGSGATGPYYFEWDLKHHSNIINTSERIDYGMMLYNHRYPSGPDIIYFHTVEWDYSYLALKSSETLQQMNSRYTFLWNKSIETFETNTLERLDQLKSLIQKYNWHSTQIGLRTGAFHTANDGNSICNPDKGEKDLFKAMNDVVKRISIKQKIILYDLNKDIWSTVGFDYTRCDLVMKPENVIRHPNDRLSVLMVEKLIGQRYSRFIHYRGNPLPETMSKLPQLLKRRSSASLNDASHSNKEDTAQLFQRVFLVRDKSSHREYGENPQSHHHHNKQSEGHTYFLSQNISGHFHKHEGAEVPLLRALGMSDGDVLLVSGEQLQGIPTGEPVSEELIDATKQLVTKNQRIAIRVHTGPNASNYTYMLLQNRELRPVPFDLDTYIPSVNYLSFLTCLDRSFVARNNKTVELKVYDVEPWFLNLTRQGKVVPRIYHEGALIRYKKDTLVYAVLNYAARKVNSGKVFTNRGWNFSDIIVVNDEQDILMLTKGETLHN